MLRNRIYGRSADAGISAYSVEAAISQSKDANRAVFKASPGGGNINWSPRNESGVFRRLQSARKEAVAAMSNPPSSRSEKREKGYSWGSAMGSSRNTGPLRVAIPNHD